MFFDSDSEGDMKRITSVFTVICIVLASLVFSVQALDGECGANGSNLTWRYDKDSRTLIIEGKGDMKDWRNSRLVPWKDIREEAEHISLPEGLTSIGSYAFFKFTSLKEINIPRSVRTIGNGSISVCTSLTDVSVPYGVTDLGGWCFASCTSLENISFPSTLKTINYECFLNCPKLMDVTIPQSVTSINGYAFGFGKSHCYYYDMVLRAPSGSPAERYAAANKLNFAATNGRSFPKDVLTQPDFTGSVASFDINGDKAITAKDLLLFYRNAAK